MAKSLKFTLEVNGLDISERAQAEISKALNQTLMHKLGELDLMEGASAAAPHALSSGTLYTNKFLINGGLLYKTLAADAIAKEFGLAADKLANRLGLPNASGMTTQYM